MKKYLRGKKAYWVLAPCAMAVFFWGVSLWGLPVPLGSNEDTFKYVAEGVEDKQNEVPEKPKVIHLATPEPMKGIYMTSCVASTPSMRVKLVKLIEETELNSIVIDIKDYTGRISISTKNPLLQDSSVNGCGVKDMKEFVQSLHEKGIYVVGRITVFQDPAYTKKHPELAVKKGDGKTVWRDRKGLSFIDVGAKEYWDYIIALSKESYELGFDELNFDYIRFPSDGDMKDISYTFSGAKIKADPKNGKAEALKEFFVYLHGQMEDTGAVLSADLFGMTMTNKDDLNIGQVLENTAPYFDYIMPMVYPSHYPTGFNGWKDPNKVPYEIVKFSMDEGVRRLVAMAVNTEMFGVASTTPVSEATEIPDVKKFTLKLRPWLQDNDYPVHYTPEMVKAQIKATYDAGLTSWALWDAANTYTRAALLAPPGENEQ